MHACHCGGIDFQRFQASGVAANDGFALKKSIRGDLFGGELPAHQLVEVVR